VFDEGRLSDSKGNAVDYRNTVILMTSNLGSDVLAGITLSPEEREQIDAAALARAKCAENNSVPTPQDCLDELCLEARAEALRVKKIEAATKLVHAHFSPEFVNRLDDIVVFNPLSPEAMLRICALQLQKVTSLLAGRDMALLVSDRAVKQLALVGTDPLYGARPMKRLIQNALLNPLATLILQVSFNSCLRRVAFCSSSFSSSSFI
jgi:ATP-dependent Clp protease ATP-binding subunit ClpB